MGCREDRRISSICVFAMVTGADFLLPPELEILSHHVNERYLPKASLYCLDRGVTVLPLLGLVMARVGQSSLGSDTGTTAFY